MFGLDERLAALGDGETLLLVIVVAVLLGLRHATDPDHLTAVSTLVAGERERTGRRAAALGAAWGCGHATTLFAFGLPVILFDDQAPRWVSQAAEVLIGLVIIGLALRLLMRWRHGYFHMHAHTHDGLEHTHPHAHPVTTPRGDAHVRLPHAHVHPVRPRSCLGAYGVGLVHGIGGSAGVGVLLLAAIPNPLEGVAALSLFALCTIASMVIASFGLGYTISRRTVRHAFATVAPTLGALSLIFGAWYALGALEAVPYML